MITRRNTLWLIPLLLILTFPIWKHPVGSFLTPRGHYDIANFKTTKRTNKFTLESVIIMQSGENKKNSNIRAEKAINTGPNRYALFNVDADIINEKGNTISIIAETGVYNSLKRKLQLRKNVVITNLEDGSVMTSDLVHYNEKTRIVFSPGPAEFTGDGIFIKGSTFRHSVDRGVYKIGGRVFCRLEGYELQ